MRDYLRGMSKEEFAKAMNDCVDKMEGLNDKDWSEIVSDYDMDISRDCLRKSFTAPLGGYAIYRYMNELNSSDDEKLKEIEDKRLELEKEKIRFQDQRREYKKYLRQDARFEHLKDTIKAEIRKISSNKELTEPYCKPMNSNREAVLILSDWHIGVTNDNHWNKFNLDIAKQRINKLLNKTIEYCELHNVNTIHIEILGDIINGYLHVGNRIENEEDVISQTMTAAEILCEFVTELSAHISTVKIYSATGNHGRCTSNLKDSIEVENFERLITWYMKSRLNNNRIEFIDNEIDDNIIVMRFLNETIYACHGHMDKPNSAISNLSRMLKEFPTEAHFGHYHSYKEFDEYDMTTTVNGTLSGVDEYAKRIRKTGSPMQVLMIYNEEGRECTYKIKL